MNTEHDRAPIAAIVDENKFPDAITHSINEQTAVIFDTSIHSDNLGDEIIMSCCNRVLDDCLGAEKRIYVPTHTVPNPNEIELIKKANLKILCGTNILSPDIDRFSFWKLPRDLSGYTDLIAFGLDWMYYSSSITEKSRDVYRRIFSERALHSVRNSYTEKKMWEMGIFNVVNTGCPTLWQLTPEHCSRIPSAKASRVVTTLTAGIPDEEADSYMLDVLEREYEKVYIWLQGNKDYPYFSKLKHRKIEILPGGVDAYTQLLRSGDIDYVGNRLHGGIHALNCGVRALMISIDNRAAEMGKDFHLPVIPREKLSERLKAAINQDRKTVLQIPWDNIERWKAQFKTPVETMPRCGSVACKNAGKDTVRVNTNKNKPRASIIVIAYNDETHIERAIRSACSQTEKNLEIICVDDGSTDSTYERMCQCAARDDRIKTITQPNGGILAARYAGLQQASCGYTLFLDSDDYLSPNAVQTACDAADELGADVMEFGVDMVMNSDNPPSEIDWNWLERYYSQEKPLPEVACGSRLINACFDELVIPWNVWNKLYRTDVLRAALREYRGERVNMCEDMLLTLMVLCHAKHYARINAKLYIHMVGGGMSTTSAHGLSSDDLNRRGIEWLVLKLAREWLDKIAYPQDQITPAMEMLAGHVRENIYISLTERYAPDTRREYLKRLAQSCTQEEFADLLSMCIDCQQALLEQSPQEYRQFVKNPGQQQARIKQLEAHNRALQESFDTISNSTCWKMTKPVRRLLDLLKWLYRGHAQKGLLRIGMNSLRIYGLRVTWQKILQKIYNQNSVPGDDAKMIKRELFTEKQLARQRQYRFPRKIKFSIVVPLFNTPERFLREMIESVQAQTYADWELCIADGSDTEFAEMERICREYAEKDGRIRYRKLGKNLGISGNTNACLEMATGDYIGLFDHDDLLHPAALYEVMRAICKKDADFIYTDETTFHDTPEDAYLPHFKPAFAPDNLRGSNYICHFTVFKRSLLDEVGLFDPACDGSQDHDMVLRLTEKAERIAHIPEILYYCRAHAGSAAESTGGKPYVIEAGVRAVKKQLERLGMEGTVEPVKPGMTSYRVRYAIKGTPKVSILIPNYEHMEDLKTCLDSVFNKTTWSNYEIVIVENNSRSPELFAYYEALQRAHENVRVVTWEGKFNYSAVNNYGARLCTGDYLLLLNNDTEVITPDWIQEMLMFAQRPDVGAVGAKLYYPDDTIQHAGVILGLKGLADHLFVNYSRDNYGYMGRLLYAQNFTAVTAACMLLRRDVWDQMNGLDEAWAVAFNDVDLCMRIRKAGYLIVWTPFAELYHYESKSRGIEDTPEKMKRAYSEIAHCQQRWKKELKAGDPYFNPNFSLYNEDYSPEPVIRQHDAR